MKENTCCFIGHRKIDDTPELRERLNNIIEKLIKNENTYIFMFGSKSAFDALCLELVTKAKEKHPQIQRIYVRAEYPYISDSYKAYLLKSYDGTYYPERMLRAGRAAYVERNRELIDNSRVCIFHYSPDSEPQSRKSGTRIAYEYATKMNKEIVNTAETAHFLHMLHK